MLDIRGGDLPADAEAILVAARLRVGSRSEHVLFILITYSRKQARLAVFSYNDIMLARSISVSQGLTEEQHGIDPHGLKSSIYESILTTTVQLC